MYDGCVCVACKSGAYLLSTAYFHLKSPFSYSSTTKQKFLFLLLALAVQAVQTLSKIPGHDLIYRGPFAHEMHQGELNLLFWAVRATALNDPFLRAKSVKRSKCCDTKPRMASATFFVAQTIEICDCSVPCNSRPRIDHAMNALVIDNVWPHPTSLLSAACCSHRTHRDDVHLLEKILRRCNLLCFCSAGWAAGNPRSR